MKILKNVRNLSKVLKKLDTPFYLYDGEKIARNIDTLTKVFSNCRVELFFAVKANTALGILKIIKEKGVGAEVVSPGELFISLKAGFKPSKILYNNIARKKDEVIYSIKRGVVFYNFEALDQALLLEECAKKLRRKIKIFVRINPGIFSNTHPHLATGSPMSKFGIPMNELKNVVNLVRRYRFVELVGIHSHIGSQILTPVPFVMALKKVEEAIQFFNNNGIKIGYINLGGGFGIPYHPDERELNFVPIARAYENISKRYQLKTFLEPGRFIVGNAGYIATTIISVKKRKGTNLYIIDAGMTENPRPALYGAYHHIESLFKKNGKQRETRIAGPLCENTDEFGIYKLSPLNIRDMLIIYNCGAYTRTMASNYNGRLLPPEIIVDRHGLAIIRVKQQLKGLIQNEKY